MPATILVGAQWGDEGKGRIADWLARDADAVARYAGGDNAGHTVSVGGQTFQLHLVPSGVIHPHVRCILGSGMVINPIRLVHELRLLDERGIDISPERIHVSLRAHVIVPAHLELDGARERALGKASLGTTRRGIGPAYQDKAARTGLLVADMLDPDRFAARVQRATEDAAHLLSAQYGLESTTTGDLGLEYGQAAAFLRPYLADTVAIVHDLLESGGRLLCEGAQGTLLDLDHGHYPYVTSSSPIAGGALTGLGFGPRQVDRVIGVAKAYATRVGGGPFPTEQNNPTGDRLRATGREYGTTTGRPRRCGWLDAVALRYAARVNGFTELILTKLDVLTGFDPLALATAYDLPDGRTQTLPIHTGTFEQAVPVYETLPGWTDDLGGVRCFEDLPAAAQAYVQRVEALAGVPVSLISVGPEREQAIERTRS